MTLKPFPYQPLTVWVESLASRIVNPIQSERRVEYYLELAKNLLTQPSRSENEEACLIGLWISAIDLGSPEAAIALAHYALNGNNTVFSKEEGLYFMGLAAEWGLPEACYELALGYGGIDESAEAWMHSLRSYFELFSQSERQALAIRFLEQAIEKKYRPAIEELVIAYAYGRGLITKNKDAFIALCERLIMAGDQYVALGYGAWLAGITVEGDPTLPDAIQLELDYSKALHHLCLVTEGESIEVAQHALYLIGLLASEQVSPVFSKTNLRETFDAMLNKGNQVLALYYGWYALPLYRRPFMDEYLKQQSLVYLAEYVPVNEKMAMHYLDRVLLGPSKGLVELAKSIVLKVFAFNEEGVCVSN